MGVPKEYKMVVKNEIPKQKIQVLSEFKTNFFNASDFELKFLQRDRF